MRTKIYALLSPEGAIRYVGKTKNPIEERLGGHLHDARKGSRGHRSNWIRSLLKIGKLPTIQLIGEIEGDGCKEEIAWIAYFKAEGVPLTNNTLGGDGALRDITTPETRRKISQTLKGHILSEETRKKISQTLKKNPVRYWLGKHRSEDTRRKIGLAHLGGKGNGGYKFTEEDKKKLSLSLKGRKLSKEHIEKLRIAHAGFKHSPKTRAKMSLVQKTLGKKLNSGERAFVGHRLYLARKKYLDLTGGKYSPEARKRMSVAVTEWWRKRKAL